MLRPSRRRSSERQPWRRGKSSYAEVTIMLTWVPAKNGWVNQTVRPSFVSTSSTSIAHSPPVRSPPGLRQLRRRNLPRDPHRRQPFPVRLPDHSNIINPLTSLRSVFRQNGTQANTGALFLAVSQEEVREVPRRLPLRIILPVCYLISVMITLHVFFSGS